MILESMRNSKVVDVQGDKLRRRDEWMKYLPSAQVQANSNSLSPGESSYNNLTVNFQTTITLEKTTKDEGGESSHQSQLLSGSDVAGNPK
ncbi:hypothetical protein TSUD_02160 [Trifolium subterraneum]|nr:hypothetical protein TSUD_02160 [Trifolium subterraneum]